MKAIIAWVVAGKVPHRTTQKRVEVPIGIRLPRVKFGEVLPEERCALENVRAQFQFAL